MALAIGWGVLLAVVFAWRVGFPLELEWMEGGVLHQATRFQAGEALYPEPSVEFVPFLYTPLYAIVVGVLGFVVPLGFVLGRVVSIASIVAIAWGIASAIEFEGKPPAHRWAGVGLFASGYVFAFRWLDLVRPDALFMALTVWGLVLLRRCGTPERSTRWTPVWAGLLIALAFWTKQTAATFILASGVAGLLVAPRRLWLYVLTVAIVDGGGVLLFDALTEGRLWHYIYELHQSHAFNHERFAVKTWGMFVHAGPFVAFAVLIGGVGQVVSRRRTDRQDLASIRALAYWGLFAVTGLLVSALGYATQWAEPNAFIPGVTMGAIALAVLLPMGGIHEVVALGLVGAQMLFSLVLEPLYHPIQTHGWKKGFPHSYAWQDPWRTVPKPELWARATDLRTSLERFDGPLLALHRPWWSVLAGGSGHVGSMGLSDIETEQTRAIEAELRRRLVEEEYAGVWLEGEPPRWLSSAMRGYRVERRLHGRERVRPMSGWMSEAGVVTPYRRDQVLWVRQGPRSRPPGATVIADFEDGRVQPFDVDARAFGRRAVTDRQGRLLAMGPFGGRFMLSSAGPAGRVQSVGQARSPVFRVPAGGHLEFLVGHTGDAARLHAFIVDARRPEERVELEIPGTYFELQPLRWTPPTAWAGRDVRLELLDDSTGHALFVDDVWVVTPEA